MNILINGMVLYVISAFAAFATASADSPKADTITQIIVALAIVTCLALIKGTHNGIQEKSAVYSTASRKIDKVWGWLFRIVVSVGFAVFVAILSALFFDSIAPRATWTRYAELVVMIMSFGGAIYFAFRKKKNF